MSILTKSGFEQFMRRYYPSLADRTETLQYINEQLIDVLEQYKLDTTKMVPSYENLPTPGEEGTIYIVPKSTAVERRGQFVCYAYENGGYVQVGSALFPEDVPVDLVTDPTSPNAISNMAFNEEYDKKHDAADITNAINNHNELIVTSDAIYNEVIKKAEWPNVRRIKNNEVFAIVREDPDYVTMVYPTIILDPVDKTGALDTIYTKPDQTTPFFSNMKYHSGNDTVFRIDDWRYGSSNYDPETRSRLVYRDPNSLDLINVHAGIYVYHRGSNAEAIVMDALRTYSSQSDYWYWASHISTVYILSSYYQRACNYRLTLEFKDAIPLATLKHMGLNIQPNRNIEFTVKYRTSLDTDEYTVVQDKVVYTSSNTYLPCYSS
jgi:hypothetical protein